MWAARGDSGARSFSAQRAEIVRRRRLEGTPRRGIRALPRVVAAAPARDDEQNAGYPYYPRSTSRSRIASADRDGDPAADSWARAVRVRAAAIATASAARFASTRGPPRCIVPSVRFTIRIATAVGLAVFGQAVALAAMDLTAPAAFDGTGLERGVILIRCSTDIEHVVRQSRGSVLDIEQPRAKRDVVLTAAHGLPDSAEAIRRSCWAIGAHGRRYRISAVWRAPANSADMVSDWAVLLVDGRVRGEVGRLRAGSVSGAYWFAARGCGGAGASRASPSRAGRRRLSPSPIDCPV